MTFLSVARKWGKLMNLINVNKISAPSMLFLVSRHLKLLNIFLGNNKKNTKGLFYALFLYMAIFRSGAPL